MSRTLRRPMFRRGGPANDGIMSGIEDRKKFQDDPLKNFDVENVGKSARGFIEQFEPLLREYTPKTRLPLGQVGFALASGADPIEALGAGYTQFTKADDAREAAIRKGAASMGISQAISQEQNRLKQLLKDPRISLEKKVDYIRANKKNRDGSTMTVEQAIDYVNRSIGDVSKGSDEQRIEDQKKLLNNPGGSSARSRAKYAAFLQPHIPREKEGGLFNMRGGKFPKNPVKSELFFDIGSDKLYEFQGGDPTNIDSYRDVTATYNLENYKGFATN